MIGEGLTTTLATATTPAAAVDEWAALQHPFVQELEKWPWFTEMMHAIAQRSLESVGWGLILRVSLSAALSYIDIITDIYANSVMHRQGKSEYANGTAVLIGVSLFTQCFSTFVQNHRKPKAMLVEVVYTLIFMKPALDAYRVGIANPRREHQMFSPFLEQGFCKSVLGRL